MATKNRREYGSGSISQRKDGTWTARMVIGLNENGKPKVKAFYGKTENEVKHKLKQYKTELAKNDNINVAKKTLGAYLLDWLTSRKRLELKDTSYDRLDVTIRNQIIPFVGDIQLAAFSSSDAQRLISTLADSGYSYSTIKKVYDCLNDCLRTGVISRELPFNPMLGVTLPAKSKFEESAARFYLKNEIESLYKAARKEYSNGKRVYRLGELVILVLNTGMRAAELLSLKWDDVCLSENNPHISINSTRVIIKDRAEDALRKYKTIEQSSGKSRSSIRDIPLNSDAIDALKYLKGITGEFKYVLSTQDGRPLGQRYLDRTCRNIEVAAGLPEDRIFGIHSLRHTFATMLINNDVDIKVVSSLLGHSDITITYNTYIHVIEEHKKSAVDNITVMPSIM